MGHRSIAFARAVGVLSGDSRSSGLGPGQAAGVDRVIGMCTFSCEGLLQVGV